MKITPIGAASGEVTGSCSCVQTEDARILLDCGLFPGRKKSEALNRAPSALNDEQRAALSKSSQQKLRLSSVWPAMGEVIDPGT